MNVDLQRDFKLIDGKFSPTEAKSILFALINSKINFHSLESFGITVRSSGDTSFHEKRIEELKETNAGINSVLDYAEKNGFKLKINGVVHIELVNG